MHLPTIGYTRSIKQWSRGRDHSVPPSALTASPLATPAEPVAQKCISRELMPVTGDGSWQDMLMRALSKLPALDLLTGRPEPGAILERFRFASRQGSRGTAAGVLRSCFGIRTARIGSGNGRLSEVISPA